MMCFQKKIYLVLGVFLGNTLEQISLQCSGAPVSETYFEKILIRARQTTQSPIKKGIYEKEATADWPIRITIPPEQMESEIKKELSRRWIKLGSKNTDLEKDVKVLARDLLETRLQLNAAEDVIKQKDLEINNKVPQKCVCIFDTKKQTDFIFDTKKEKNLIFDTKKEKNLIFDTKKQTDYIFDTKKEKIVEYFY